MILRREVFEDAVEHLTDNVFIDQNVIKISLKTPRRERKVHSDLVQPGFLGVS